MTLRILLLITQLELAGAQKAILELARGLAQAGHSVVVVAFYDKANYLPHFAEIYQVEIISLAMKESTPRPWFYRLWRLLAGLVRLFQLLRQRRIQILQSYTHYSNWLGPIVGRLAGVSYCVTSQRGSLDLLPTWARWVDRWITNSPLVAKMSVVSHATLAECQANGIRHDKLLVIRNGVDFAAYPALSTPDANDELRARLRLSPTDRVVLTIARLHPQKGHLTLLQAAQQVITQVPNVKFVWVGEGELMALLQQKRDELGLQKNLFLVGAQARVQEYYQLADLFVLPSEWEGLPNVLLEATSANVPVIATRVGGVAEIIPDEGGCLTPPHSPHLLAEAILDLLSNPARCRQLCEHAHRHVRQTFAQSTTLQAYLHLYAELLTDE